jgi:hypothetical protein
MSRDQAISKSDRFYRIKNYDGIVDKSSGGIAVYEPNQIKSAIGNTGAFSRNDNNIRYSIAPKNIASPADSKAVVETKTQAVVTWLKNHSPDTETMIYNFQDRMVDMLRQIEQVQKAGGTVDEVINPYLAEELYSQRAASRIDEFFDKDFKPILKALHDFKIDYDDFQTFLHARHAPSHNKVMAERNPNQALIDKEQTHNKSKKSGLIKHPLQLNQFVRLRRLKRVQDLVCNNY